MRTLKEWIRDRRTRKRTADSFNAVWKAGQYNEKILKDIADAKAYAEAETGENDNG